jgi:MFS transporter, DHA1 family, multidrug resistance protein
VSVSGRHKRPLVLFVLGLLGAFGPLSIDTYLPALPRVVSQLHTSSSVVQVSITTSLLGLALGQLVAVPASDRHGRRPVVIAGCAGFVISSILCALTPNIWLLIFFRLLQGCSGAAGIVVARAIVRDLYSGIELSRIFSRLLLVTGTAPVVAPIIGAQILRITGWRGVFWVLAGIGLVVLIMSAVIIPETLPAPERTNHRLRDDLTVYGRILRDREFRPYMLSACMFSGVLFGFISGSPFVIQNIYGHSPTVFSFVFGGVSAAMIALGQYNARLVRSVSLELLTRAGISMAVIGSVGVLLVGIAGTGVGMWLFIVALLVAVSPNGVVTPNLSAMAMQRYRTNVGAAAALMGVSTFLLGGLVAPLVGVAGEETAVPLGIVMATCAVAALVLLVTLEQAARRARPEAL